MMMITIYIYIERERERQTETERDRERLGKTEYILGSRVHCFESKINHTNLA